MGTTDSRQLARLTRALDNNRVEYLYIGKTAAIIHGFADTTQDADIYVHASSENKERVAAALRELGFALTSEQELAVKGGRDFIQLHNGPFDLDLIYAPDGIENFEQAMEPGAENRRTQGLLDRRRDRQQAGGEQAEGPREPGQAGTVQDLPEQRAAPWRETRAAEPQLARTGAGGDEGEREGSDDTGNRAARGPEPGNGEQSRHEAGEGAAQPREPTGAVTGRVGAMVSRFEEPATKLQDPTARRRGGRGCDHAERETGPSTELPEMANTSADRPASDADGPIHPEATVHPQARVGAGTAIGAGAIVGREATIGPQAAIGDGAVIGARARIGTGARIGPRACIDEHAAIGTGAIIGAGSQVGAGARTGTGVTMGAGAVIGTRSRIGEGCELAQAAAVGSDARLGASSRLGARALIGNGARVGRGCVLETGSTVSEGAEAGDGTRLGPEATLGAHASVGRNAHVAARTRVPAGVSFGDNTTVTARNGARRGTLVDRGVRATRQALDATRRAWRDTFGEKARPTASAPEPTARPGRTRTQEAAGGRQPGRAMR